MGEVLIRRGQPSALGTGTQQVAGANSFGAAQIDDQLLRWLMEGRMFAAAVGDGSTEIAFAKSAYDENQPQIVVSVPSGTSVIPVSLNFVVEAQEDIPASVILGYTQNDIGIGGSTNVTIQPMKTDGNGSSCTVSDLYTGDSAALTNKIELHRWTMAFDPAVDAAAPLRNFEWGIRTHTVPLLVGPASFIVWAFAETTSDLEGYATVTWAEFPSSELS